MMPPVLTKACFVACNHGGVPTVAVSPSVKVMGSPVVVNGPASVAGCPGIPPNVPPCTLLNWMTAATSVKSGGKAVQLLSSAATIAPQGSPIVMPAGATVRAT
jgi:hypothetical protein